MFDTYPKHTYLKILYWLSTNIIIGELRITIEIIIAISLFRGGAFWNCRHCRIRRWILCNCRNDGYNEWVFQWKLRRELRSIDFKSIFTNNGLLHNCYNNRYIVSNGNNYAFLIIAIFFARFFIVVIIFLGDFVFTPLGFYLCYFPRHNKF